MRQLRADQAGRDVAGKVFLRTFSTKHCPEVTGEQTLKLHIMRSVVALGQVRNKKKNTARPEGTLVCV